MPNNEVIVYSLTDYCFSFRMKGTKTTALNMGSYNYLGFAQNEGPCADSVDISTKELGCGVASSRHEMGMQK